MFVVSIMVFGVTFATLGLLEQVYGYERITVGMMMCWVGAVYCIVGLLPYLTAHRIDFRFWALSGLTLLAISCFTAQTLTVQSDLFELGTVVAMRAVGVALSLGPITAWALSSFTKELYPKGSSLITFIRQLGAVLGSGIIIMVADTRQPLHVQRYGEQIEAGLPRFEQYVAQIQTQLLRKRGSAPLQAQIQTRQLLFKDVNGQARISAILDAEYIIGWLIIAVIAILLLGLLYPSHRLSADPNLS